MSQRDLSPQVSSPVATDRRGVLRPADWRTGIGLILAVVAIFAACMVLAPKTGDEAFGGADAAVTTMLDESGVEPWFTPIFEPGSSEIESGLFAVQAALGAGVLGYCLGRLRSRATSKPDPAQPDAGE